MKVKKVPRFFYVCMRRRIFDTGKYYGENAENPIKSRQNKKSIIMNDKNKTHFLALYSLMLSDGTIDITELEVLYKIGIQRGISKDEINAYVMSPGTMYMAPNTFEEKVAMLYDFALLAWADGKIVEEEKKLIKTFCIKFGFLKENAEKITEFLLEEVKNGTTEEELLNQLK